MATSPEMKMKWTIGFTVGVALLGAFAFGDRPTTTDLTRIIDGAATGRIDSTLAAFVDAGTIAGASALVFEKGEEVYFNTFGMADREAGVPMTRDVIVSIASMTKPITGVALMRLYEEGAFQLNDPLAMHAPEFSEMRVFVGLDSSGAPLFESPRREIAIRDITRHTAGFIAGSAPPEVHALHEEADPMNLDNTLAEMARRLASVPLWHHPGERWSYGPSMDVQAFLVERLSGQPFDQYIKEHIFDPLGMTHTRHYVPEGDRGRVAALYRREEDATLSRLPDEQAHAGLARDWPLKPGGWGLTSTIDDYARFSRMLLNGGHLEGARILRPETVRLMATNHLDESVMERSWLPSKGQVGFGINFAVRMRPPASPNENNGAVGEFFWDGAASTLFWVDPRTTLPPFSSCSSSRSTRSGCTRRFATRSMVAISHRARRRNSRTAGAPDVTAAP